MRKVFKTVKKGYNPIDVDNYISQLEDQLTEYKNMESAITKAVVEAQITAENIIKKAKQEADIMKDKSVNDLDNIKYGAIEIKKKLEHFQQDYNTLIQDYLTTIRSQELIELFNNLDTLIDYLELQKLNENDTNDDESFELDEVI